MFRFRLEIAGEVQMDRGIARFADGLSDYRPIWPIIEDDFYAQEKSQFKSEGKEGGAGWQPLSGDTGERDEKGKMVHSYGYAQWKEARYPGKPILERTGDLMRSLTEPNDPNAVRIEERKTLTLGTRIPYAIYHQTGTKNHSADGARAEERMPARPEIQLTEGFKRTTMHHVQQYLVQMATQCGFRSGEKPLDVGWQQAWAARKGMGGHDGWPM